MGSIMENVMESTMVLINGSDNGNNGEKMIR